MAVVSTPTFDRFVRTVFDLGRCAIGLAWCPLRLQVQTLRVANDAVTTLNAGCYVLELKATNRCGTTAVQKDIDVLSFNFSLSLTPFCEADPDAVVLSDLNDVFNCDVAVPC